jgi:DNA-binding beta-propeller fold protein YncE
MKNNFRLPLAWLASGFLGIMAAPLLGADGPYHFVKEIPVGGDGGWDYASVDPAAHRLYVTHGTKVVVIDLQQDKVVGEVADTPGVHGFCVAPKLGRGFASNGRENKVSIVELATLKTLAKVDTGTNPDAILFEPVRGEVYAFNGRSQSATVFEAATGKVVTTIPLGGKPEFAVCDPDAGRIYNNLEDKNEIVALDTQTHAVVNHWPIAPGEEASGLAIDVAHHRLFAACGNEKLVMLDSRSGKVLANVPVGPGVDAAAFDPGTQFVFVSAGGNGTVTVARADAPDKLAVVQTLATEKGARTMTLDPTTHRIYLASAKFEAGSGEGRRRPPMVPGTFKVLVYGMDK